MSADASSIGSYLLQFFRRRRASLDSLENSTQPVSPRKGGGFRRWRLVIDTPEEAEIHSRFHRSEFCDRRQRDPNTPIESSDDEEILSQDSSANLPDIMGQTFEVVDSSTGGSRYLVDHRVIPHNVVEGDTPELTDHMSTDEDPTSGSPEPEDDANGGVPSPRTPPHQPVSHLSLNIILPPTARHSPSSSSSSSTNNGASSGWVTPGAPNPSALPPPDLQRAWPSLHQSAMRRSQQQQDPADIEAERYEFKRKLRLLPTHKFVPPKTNSGVALQCPICMCEYETDEALRTLPCFHRFHTNCIDRWLCIKRYCPVCKYDPVKDIVLIPRSSLRTESGAVQSTEDLNLRLPEFAQNVRSRSAPSTPSINPLPDPHRDDDEDLLTTVL
mmetsp:Transcript_38446/g.62300  ORF Transcript_38446/g.62300 Transcript_38446/m.62300 type:complete len:385 (+) Transcript_38446:252-1406(+)|eukprot:CAMPEP_0184658750 /NCGR_PEP_ID=MMETSP0308-20130426/26751_1 /TAXON_ID=38269 /ORGANISM="Gloeochaete witrockiana, Strain SAG 46.84" /LENGTH=384 /DNA_ID=CAMNT_0027097979 /DNA_START=181 /DNA_END=1335 /DNA_ORIENTATION=+